MYRARSWIVVAALGLASLVAAQEPPKPAVSDYAKREVAAPAPVKALLERLRTDAKDKGFTFEVGYTEALDFRLEQLAGLVPPANLEQLMLEQNRIGAGAADSRIKERISAACSPTAASFDWRKNNGATGVRNQGGCGSCWAFATHGAFEGAYRILNSKAIDSSEQDTLDCNPWGYGCGGGWWAFQYLIDTGSATDASYAYTGVRGTCKTSVKRPYKAKAWGYAGTTSTPSAAEIKKALCQYGPLAIAVQVTPPFSAYTSGVFNACARTWSAGATRTVGDLVMHAPGGAIFTCVQAGVTGANEPAWPSPTAANPSPAVNDGSVRWQYSGVVNHGITLVGWDDAAGAWIIKNSWGANWGETAGVGTERGYMRLTYGCNNAGYGAAWVQAAKGNGC